MFACRCVRHNEVVKRGSNKRCGSRFRGARAGLVILIIAQVGLSLFVSEVTGIVLGIMGLHANPVYDMFLQQFGFIVYRICMF